MELEKPLNTNDENSFDPTPKLKSSPIPILFISFNEYGNKCLHCGDEYTETLFYSQKYCKKCLSQYIAKTTDNNIHLDMCMYTMTQECNEHEISRNKESIIQNIREWCENCSGVSYFKQIFSYENSYYYDDLTNENVKDFKNKMFESEKDCKLCGKLLCRNKKRDDNSYIDFEVCSNCYLISFGHLESTFTKQSAPVLYLPWWDCKIHCITCRSILNFTSDCQKYCSYCYIYYTGCRYCLTTNIIFGSVDNSQCRKCERILPITNISCGNKNLDDYLYDQRIVNIYSNLQLNKIISNKKSDKPKEIHDLIGSKQLDPMIEWIPYSNIINLKKIAEGGFSFIYQATWKKDLRDVTVSVKQFKNSQKISEYFLNELKSHQLCYKLKHHVIKLYGFTQDPESKDYMLVMEYASKGDMHNYLQEKFTEISWNKEKLRILWQISKGLETIHNSNFIHRDFHSGNILSGYSRDFYSRYIWSGYSGVHNKRYEWQVGDLGLSQPASCTSNSEIYGVIPYTAPEIFRGFRFSKESDVYSFGMIMWEFTTGCKPFSDVEHDVSLICEIVDGRRPEITHDTPECFADLMKSCWDSNPKKRPSITGIRKILGRWFYRNKNKEQFDQAEVKRKELIESKKLGPKFTGKYHPKAIYTSRPLSSSISKISSINSINSASTVSSTNSINSTSTISSINSINSTSTFSFFNRNQEYISKELKFDIDTTQNVYNQQSMKSCSYSQNLIPRPLSALTLAVKSSKKRKIEELSLETDNNGNHGKFVKIEYNSSSEYNC